MSESTMGLVIRILAVPFLSSTKYIFPDENTLDQFIASSFICFQNFFLIIYFFYERNWTAVRNIFNRAIKIVTMTTIIQQAFLNAYKLSDMELLNEIAH